MPEPSIVTILKGQVDAAAEVRKTRLPRYQRNVDARKNKVYDTDLETDQVSVPADWNRTKNKVGQLFIHVPKVSLFPQAPQWRPVVPVVTPVINHWLKNEIHAEEPVEEALGDAINAAGVGAIYVSYEADFEAREEPQDDLKARNPLDLIAYVKEKMGMGGPGQIPMATVQKPVYQKIEWTSVEPAHFLYPLSFTKIAWRKSPWLGHNFQISRAEAIRKKWITEDERTGSEPLTSVSSKTEEDARRSDEKVVDCIRIWYRPHLYDAAENDCRKLKVIVWVNGKKDPVMHEDFPWQKYSPETREWIGMTGFPIKPITLTHISGEAVPPSDTEISAGTVMELNRSRTQMIQQRKDSKPLRWYDVNLVDEEIIEQIRRGTWQDMIPTQGPGNNVIGEVARASYPRESWDFDRVFNQDLDNAWSMGPNQGGFEAEGSTSATEAQITQQNFAVGLEHQRAKVLAWFLECAEATLDLMQMFFEDERFVPFVKIGGEQALVAWDRERIPGKYVFSALPDAAVRLDANQKRANTLNVYKLLRRDELVNAQYLIGQVFESHDLDPSEAFAPPPPPQEQKPKPPTYAFRGEDFANPLVVALSQKGVPVTPQDIQAARLLMADCGIPIAPATIVPDPQQVDTGGPPPGPVGMDGKSQPHPGVTPEVTPINQRFSENGGNVDQGMVGEGTGQV